MNCKKVKNLLSLYIDDMLEEDQAHSVREHLVTCDCCRQEYEELRAIVNCLQQLPTPPLPAFYEEKIRTALKSGREEPQRWLPKGRFFAAKRWAVLASTAAVFAVGILSFAYYQDAMRDLADTFSSERMLDASDASPYGVAEADSIKNSPLDVYDAESQEEPASGELKKSSSVLPAGLVPTKVHISHAKEVEASEESAPFVEEPEAAVEESPLFLADLAQAESASADQKEDKSESYHVAERGTADGGNYSVSRHLPLSGGKTTAEDCQEVEGNSAAARYYRQLLEDSLEGYAYQVTASSYHAAKDAWCFKVFIFHEEEGNTYNKEIAAIGKNGKVKILWSQLGME